MATRFMYKALSIASLGIALSLLLAATTTASPASGNTAGALELDPPAAPSNCKTKFVQAGGKFFYGFTVVSWRDNSTNEDGFILETWRKQSGTWVLAGSVGTQANVASVAFPASFGSNYKFRVKAFNAAGESAWSNWGH
jgi:hypothetical protein